MLIFQHSSKGRQNKAQIAITAPSNNLVPEHLRRKTPAFLPEVSELQAVRHYTRLSQKNFSIDSHFYPLGSCTMKYNPRACNILASLPGFTQLHPQAPLIMQQGFMACMFELQEILAEITGMPAISLAPMAGAQGEFAGIAMIKAYHDARNDTARCEILVPDAAHGTNPATAVMCGYKVREIPTNLEGDVDISALKAAISEKTAGIMLTNPSTLGVFERQIKDISDIIHKAGGLLYYDGANLNAILGKVRPGDMGFDVIHMNLHKTFSTPHGGGGPGAGPVGVSHRLRPYLPVPIVVKNKHSDNTFTYQWEDEQQHPQSIGQLSAYNGNAGILLRAYIYARMLGKEGMIRVAEYATLNANYMMQRLKNSGFEVTFPRRATHEFIISLRYLAKHYNVNAMDFAKRLLDKGFHAPTTYFPLLVPECFLIEPTETESKEAIDAFVEAMQEIAEEAKNDPNLVKNAPYTLPVQRLDDVKAARELNLIYTTTNID